MLDMVKGVVHWTTMVLIAMLAVMVVLATLAFGWTIATALVTPPIALPGIETLLTLFGKLLIVLIGIELLETMRAFATEHVVRVDIVLTVAITAMARKVVVMEPDHVSGMTMLGVAALVGALGVAYHAFVRDRADPDPRH